MRAPYLDGAVITARSEEQLGRVKGDTLDKAMVSADGPYPVERVAGPDDHERVETDGREVRV